MADPGVLEEFCSGALIAPTVFLIAPHRTDGLQDRGVAPHDAFVSFDPSSTPPTSSGAPLSPNPAFGDSLGPRSHPHDVAVMLLDTPGTRIAPAQLPPAGPLDQMKAAGQRKDQQFTAVGWGSLRETNRTGLQGIVHNSERRVATQGFLSLATDVDDRLDTPSARSFLVAVLDPAPGPEPLARLEVRASLL